MKISKNRIRRIIQEELRRYIGESNNKDNVIDLADYDREEVADFNPNYDPYPDSSTLSREESEDMRSIGDMTKAKDVEDLDDEFEAYLKGREEGTVEDPFDRE